ncbi:heavy-metal-associated domain-containing protein [Aequorivita sp. H23M31]|uniref:Heavy-metal-associated domain-containing protein n=1 Tax=Aequorivita ciconiae TaxID=2494375 RepID=A0A410G0Y8_9FLAO|nr:heavy-metal-associated domain-containing protein [Aequorivita sp. H23M31]QAA80927.1 heavy-metal-associated domain-containing protein [Aequorivita sp. H23M31]
MSLLSENVIPGNHGKVFGTNAENGEDLDRIIEAVRSVKGVSDVIIDEKKYPKEFKVLTSKLVKIKTIEKRVNAIGFHTVPTGLFEL